MSKKLLIALGFGLMLGACATQQSSNSSGNSAAADSEPGTTNDSAGEEAWSRQEDAAAVTTQAAKDAKAQAKPEMQGKDPWGELRDAVQTNNDDSIRRVAEKILSRVPDDARSLNALAMTYYRSKRYDLAAYLMVKAIQKNPARSELHSNLGLIELGRHEQTAALKAFHKALELNPDDSAAAANIGAIYVAEKDFVKAVVVLEIAARRYSRDPKIMNNYGIALAATGKDEQALVAYDDALKANGTNPEVMLNKAILLVDHLGKMREGLDLLNRVKFLGPPPESSATITSLENKAQAGVK